MNTDYAKPEHWLAQPVVLDKAVDVFFLYPTAWDKVDENEANICAIDNPSMLLGSKAALGRLATAFETTGNIFAPYYRQVDAAYCLSLPLVQQEQLLGGIPTADVSAAFDYYIQNFNHGRPFILAGHSQGSSILVYLLAGYLKEHPEVYNRMIAAYMIGYSVTGAYLAQNPHLKFAEGPEDTGVIISYNVEAPSIEGSNPVLLPGAIAINPITWTRDETPASAQENLGSLLWDQDNRFLLPVKNYADARVNTATGAVICSTADAEQLYVNGSVFGRGVYHVYDFLFYYYNIRENAANRAKRYLGSHQEIIQTL